MSETGPDLLPDLMPEVELYKLVVERYEAIDEVIDSLIMDHDGATENMSDDDLAHYRALARERDELFNQMRTMEQRLLPDEDNAG